MATSPPAGQPVPQNLPLGMRLRNFWRRVTEGLEVSQLWSQFESEARASYRLYSKDVAAKTPEGLTDRGRRLHVVKEFFWAVFEKLSPARRVLLLFALILLVDSHTEHLNTRARLARFTPWNSISTSGRRCCCYCF